MLRKIIFSLASFGVLFVFFTSQVSGPTSYRIGSLFIPRFFSFPKQVTNDTTVCPPVELIFEDSSVDQQTIDYMVKGIHFMYKFYITKFAYEFPTDFAVKIRVFSDMNEYQTYTSRIASSPISSHIGLYVHRLQEVVVYQGPDTARFLRTVFHETNHLLLRSHSNFAPRWLNEGLSEYFEGLNVVGMEPMVEPQFRKDQNLKKRATTGEIPSLYSYLSKTNRDWVKEDDISDEPRTMAWSLIYFLMQDSKGQMLVKDMLHYFAKSHTVEQASIQAMDYFYHPQWFAEPRLAGNQYVPFEEAWLQWVEQDRTNQVLTMKPNRESENEKWVKKMAMIWG